MRQRQTDWKKYESNHKIIFLKVTSNDKIAKYNEKKKEFLTVLTLKTCDSCL
jgi:hypothetical protein